MVPWQRAGKHRPSWRGYPVIRLSALALTVNPTPCVRRIEPFSGVEIHMEMDMEWKWMEMGRNL